MPRSSTSIRLSEDEHLVHDPLGDAVVDIGTASRMVVSLVPTVEYLGGRADAAAQGGSDLVGSPTATLAIASFNSRIALGWMPSSVATRMMTSPRVRSGRRLVSRPRDRASRCTRIEAMICGCSF